jgi:hypothetical protein
MSKNTLCTDGREYSWQVAPQQSQLPLVSGKTNVGKLFNTTSEIFNKTQYWQAFHTNFSEPDF